MRLVSILMLVCALELSVSVQAEEVRYTVVDMGPSHPAALHINDRQEVLINDYYNDSQAHIFDLNTRVLRPLVSSDGIELFHGADIESQGAVTRVLGNSDAGVSILRNKEMIPLLPVSVPGLYDTFDASNMNARGQVVGTMRTFYPNYRSEPVLLDEVGALTFLAQRVSLPNGLHLESAGHLNDRGMILAFAQRDMPFEERWVLLTPDVNGNYEAELMPESIGWPYDMNNHGDIVGYQASGRFFVWQQGKEPRTVEFPGWVSNDAYVVNDQRQVLGNGYVNGELRVFLYSIETGQVQIVNDLIDTADFHSQIEDIWGVNMNNLGVITGMATLSGRARHVALLPRKVATQSSLTGAEK
ncbi:MAG: hypothetical protein QY326_05195 [Bdellovibrionota bacterium]|nr:MAG: hypothetical protein QY326_05195 [Bdellovibrionota bacterium]